MTGQQWATDEWGKNVCYGNFTYGKLRSTKGISIWPKDGMYIAYYNHSGKWTSPMIWCSEDKFEYY